MSPDAPALEATLAAGRLAYAVLALAWLALVWRTRRPALVLAGVLGANAWAWLFTNLPLGRSFALGVSHDRLNNMGLCQVVAAGNSAFQTSQVGQVHFEPFWGWLVALLSGYDPERVLWLYPWLSLATALAFAVSLWLGLRPARDAGAGGFDPWERAVVVLFASLLSSSPMDFTGTYRTPWSQMFLLKPNHALGLVLAPLVLWVLASARTWRGRVAAGVLLNLVGWTFVLHMAYLAAGLALLPILSLWLRRGEPRREAVDALVTVGVNLAAVSPYLGMLLAGYPFLVPLPAATIKPWSPHLLEITAHLGWCFPLAVWGVVLLLRRKGRLERVWAAQVVGAWAFWAAYLGLSALHLARERDEIYYWTRFVSALAAGVGAWDLAGRAWLWLRPRIAVAPETRAALLGLLLIPWTLPYWWDPLRMDPYFEGSLGPIPDWIRIPNEVLRRRSAPEAVVAGDRKFAAWVSALAARRVLLSDQLHRPDDHRARESLEAALVRGTVDQAARELRARYGVRYLVVTNSFLVRYGVPLEDLRVRSDLEEVAAATGPGQRFVVVFRLRPEAWS